MRGIGERAEQVEHGAQAQLAPHLLHLLHGGVQIGRVQKTDSDFAQALRGAFWSQLDVHAQRLHHIGRAAFRTDAAVAVLGYAHAGSRSHECRCR